MSKGSSARPLATVDVTLFAVKDNQLHVLLMRRPNMPTDPFPNAWALPGGIIDVVADQNLHGCALRKLQEKTGLKAPYLEQVGCWGSSTRDPRGWSTAHVYLCLVSNEEIYDSAAGSRTDLHWEPVHETSVSLDLAFDHATLIQASVNRLRSKVEYTALPILLMPSEFTIPDLQKMYEVLLNRSLEKKAFRTRFLSVPLLERVPRKRTTANRPAQLFRVRQHAPHYVFARPFGSASEFKFAHTHS